jgi:hypothetical protein
MVTLGPFFPNKSFVQFAAPPSFLKKVAKKIATKKTLELNVSYRNWNKMSSTSTILIMCNQKKEKKSDSSHNI